jgi:hypothetical protein
MAISIIQTPDAFEPVYTNSMPFIISSTFYFKENYKYIYNLYDTNGFLTTISTYPRPVSSYGVYSPHYVLQSIINTNIDPYITSMVVDLGSRSRYYLEFGEQYNPGLTFADTDLSTAYLGFTFSTSIVSQLFVGDIITIQKDNIALNPWIDGTASITALTSNYSIMTDKLKPGGWVPTFLESGSVLSLLRFTGSTDYFIGWNATRQYDENTIDFKDDYVMRYDTSSPFTASSTNSFLTAYNFAQKSQFTDYKPIYNSDYETLDILVGTASTINKLYTKYYFYSSSNTLLATSIFTQSTPISTDLRYQVPTGTKNIVDMNLSGASFINSGLVDYYQIEIVTQFPPSPPNVLLSDKFNYQIIPDCRPYEVVRLTFLNKLGGYDYWNFNLVSKYKSNVKRTQIDRSLSPTYNIGDRGRDVIYSTAVENWTINTDFLTDNQALFIRELVESSSVFIVENNGDILPVVIMDNTWDYKSGLLNGYVQYTIEFQKSYDVIINR